MQCFSYSDLSCSKKAVAGDALTVPDVKNAKRKPPDKGIVQYHACACYRRTLDRAVALYDMIRMRMGSPVYKSRTLYQLSYDDHDIVILTGLLWRWC